MTGYVTPGEDSHVFVAQNNDVIECHCGDQPYRTPSREEMLEHLIWHRSMGDLVPDRAFERLEREIEHADVYQKLEGRHLSVVPDLPEEA